MGCNGNEQEVVEYGTMEKSSTQQALEMVNYHKNDETVQRNTTVAVIDTKYDLSEIEDSSLWVNTKEIPNNGIDDDKNGYVDDVNGWNFVEKSNEIHSEQLCSHGTMMLNAIDDYGLEIMPISVLDDEGEGTTNSIIEAIQYAETNGADICNLSIATYEENKELEKVIHQSSMLFIVAAGNTGEELNHENKCYPACYKEDNLITVAACAADYNIIEESNFGKDYVDLAAPGDAIGIKLVNGEEVVAEGTSYATALTTRIAALIRNRVPFEYNKKNIKQLILNTVTKKESLNGKVNSSGIINMKHAIEELENAKIGKNDTGSP